MGTDDEAIIEELLAKLEAVRAGFTGDYRLATIEFEKDDDANFHMVGSHTQEADDIESPD